MKDAKKILDILPGFEKKVKHFERPFASKLEQPKIVVPSTPDVIKETQFHHPENQDEMNENPELQVEEKKDVDIEETSAKRPYRNKNHGRRFGSRTPSSVQENISNFFKRLPSFVPKAKQNNSFVPRSKQIGKRRLKFGEKLD
jgi:hypothetical protein